MAARSAPLDIKTPQPAKRAQRLSPDERREQLLACAIKAFASHGLFVATHATVAAVAQVSVPTVFFYFNTRHALVDAVLSELERFYAALYKPSDNLALSRADAIAEAAQRLTAALHTHGDYARIWLEWSVAVRSDLWPRYLRVRRRLNRMWAKAIDRGQREGSIRPDLNPEDEAAILNSAGIAFIQAREAGASPQRLEQFLGTLMQSLRPLPVNTERRAPATPPGGKRR